MPDPCRSICRYYDVDSEFRVSKTSIFDKWCSECRKNIVSRYSKCPCCHSGLEVGVIGS